MPETLAEMLRAGPLPWRQVTAIARGACNALAQMHDGKLVHGDLQPHSIYVTKRAGHSDAFDIGIAKIVGNAPGEGVRLDYQAPEHILGEATPACDIFSLGVVMFEMIVGSWPAPSGGAPVFHLQRAAIPPELGQIVMRCMSPAPQARFSVRELASTLDRLLAGSPAAKQTPRPQADAPAHVASTGLGAPVGVRRWGVAHEQLSHPDPNYTDHSLPKYVAKIAGTPQPNATAQPAPPQPATPRSSKRYVWLALIGLAGVVAGVVAVLVSGS